MRLQVDDHAATPDLGAYLRFTRRLDLHVTIG